MYGTNVSVLDPEAALDEWNNELASDFVIHNVLLVLYLVLGFSGNIIVIIVYRFRMADRREDRYFIPYLAIADLCACLAGVGANISFNTMQVKFTNNELCKATWFLPFQTQLLSVFMLVIIAVQRYLKMCGSSNNQMKRRWKHSALVLALVVSVTLSGPVILYYESVPLYNVERNLTWYRCTSAVNYKSEALIHSCIIWIILCTCIVSLICIYTRIGYALHKHFRTQREKRPRMNIKYDKPSKTGDGVSEEILMLENPGVKSRHISSTKGNYLPENADTRRTLNVTQLQASNATNRRLMRKFTLMFMLITGVFLLCYIPVSILILLDALDPNFWEKFDDKSRAALRIVFAMYIINNIVNPMIYGFMDTQFREELFLIICRCRRKVITVISEME